MNKKIRKDHLSISHINTRIYKNNIVLLCYNNAIRNG